MVFFRKTSPIYINVNLPVLFFSHWVNSLRGQNIAQADHVFLTYLHGLRGRMFWHVFGAPRPKIGRSNYNKLTSIWACKHDNMVYILTFMYLIWKRYNELDLPLWSRCWEPTQGTRCTERFSWTINTVASLSQSLHVNSSSTRITVQTQS